MTIDNEEMPPGMQIIDLHGQITELLELNNALMQRCAITRGQVVRRDTEISRLLRELEHYKSREKEAAKAPVANGDGVKHAIQ